MDDSVRESDEVMPVRESTHDYYLRKMQEERESKKPLVVDKDAEIARLNIALKDITNYAKKLENNVSALQLDMQEMTKTSYNLMKRVKELNQK